MARFLILLLIYTILLAGCSKDKQVVVQGYIEGQFIYLSSSMTGVLKSLPIYRGNPVKAHQLLFSLDPEPESAELQQANAKLAEAKENLRNLIRGQRQTILEGIMAQREQAIADFTYAKQTLTRYQKLYKAAAISKDELDQAIADYNAKKQLVQQHEANLAEAKLGSRRHLILAQESVVAAAQADIQKFKWQLEQKTVEAPKAGEIFDTFFKEGEYVPAGQAVTALLTPDNIKLIFYVPEPLLSQLKLGSRVGFQCDGCKTSYANVTYISPEAEYTPPVIYSRESRAKLVYRVECSMPAKVAVQFHPGQPVDVFLHEKLST